MAMASPAGSFAHVAPPVTIVRPGALIPSAVSMPVAPTDPRVPLVAVFVAHGMGQQVRFETLEAVAQLLRTGQSLHLHEHPPQASAYPARPEVVARQVQYAGEFLARVEMRLEDGQGGAVDAHVYEAYWAPLTEGLISARETFVFLLKAAWTGFRSKQHGGFKRHLFGDWQTWKLGHRPGLAFALTALVLASLGLMNAVVASVATVRAVTGNSVRWPSGQLLSLLTRDFTWYQVWLFVPLIVGVLLSRWGRKRRPEGGFDTPPRVLSVIGMALIYVGVVATVFFGGLVAWHLARYGMQTDATAAASTQAPSLRHMIAVWLPVMVLTGVVSAFLRQFVGDVAIYVSSHTVSRFAATRRAIQDTCTRVARCIYEARAADGRTELYDRVVVVGHSLGSVVAYDTLNAMLREDEATGRPLQADQRTSALITFGSPLDKTAYVFRSQQPGDHDVREALSSAYQPLVTDYRYRPRRWLNLYSWLDWISGTLDYYDTSPVAQGGARRVENICDLQATTPVLAHTEYWEGATLARELWKEVMGKRG